jgi:hypothetical protein
MKKTNICFQKHQVSFLFFAFVLAYFAFFFFCLKIMKKLQFLDYFEGFWQLFLLNNGVYIFYNNCQFNKKLSFCEENILFFSSKSYQNSKYWPL